MTEQNHPSNRDKILSKKWLIANWQRLAWGIAGGVFFILALVGFVLPVVPSTPFLLLTAACWAKSSVRFHQWLVHHPLFGKLIRDWQDNGAIPLLAKVVAIGMMVISCTGLFLTLPEEQIWLAWLSVAVCLVVGGWMASRPNK